jgi:hypothetical protein
MADWLINARNQFVGPKTCVGAAPNIEFSPQVRGQRVAPNTSVNTEFSPQVRTQTTHAPDVNVNVARKPQKRVVYESQFFGDLSKLPKSLMYYAAWDPAMNAGQSKNMLFRPDESFIPDTIMIYNCSDDFTVDSISSSNREILSVMLAETGPYRSDVPGYGLPGSMFCGPGFHGIEKILLPQAAPFSVIVTAKRDIKYPIRLIVSGELDLGLTLGPLKPKFG